MKWKIEHGYWASMALVGLLVFAAGTAFGWWLSQT